jgi:hypothetical protein
MHQHTGKSRNQVRHVAETENPRRPWRGWRRRRHARFAWAARDEGRAQETLV